MSTGAVIAGALVAALTYYLGHPVVHGVAKVMGKTKTGIVRMVHPHRATHPELRHVKPESVTIPSPAPPATGN